MKLLANEMLSARDRNVIPGGLSIHDQEEERTRLAQTIIRNVVNSGADVSAGATAGIRTQYSLDVNPLLDKHLISAVDKHQEL